jgi:RNA polymerase sigma-70 factor (ECF subfamily)
MRAPLGGPKECMSTLATAQEAAEPAAPVRLEPSRMAEHGTRLYRAAYALCGSRHDAEDLVQDTFERVLRHPRFIRRDHDLAYLLSVLRRTWSAQAKTAARRCTHPAPPEEFEWLPDRGHQAALEAHAAYDAIAELSEALRVTVVAVDVVGLSYKEAARALKTRKGTIMSRLFRAREQLSTALA